MVYLFVSYQPQLNFQILLIRPRFQLMVEQSLLYDQVSAYDTFACMT